MNSPDRKREEEQGAGSARNEDPAESDVEAEPEGGAAGEDSGDRRGFLARVSIFIGVVAGAAVAVPWLAIFVNPVQRRDPAVWRDVGRVEDFPPGETVQVTYLDPAPLPWAGFAARSAAWVRREEDGAFSAFTSYCTHVGCPIRWEAGARLFLCPCHGGAFYPDGSVAAGPPPRPLDRHPVRIRNGTVEVQAIGVPTPRARRPDRGVERRRR